MENFELSTAGCSTETLINGFKLLQKEPFFKLGTDAVLLAAFARVRKGFRVCDLGCGVGAVAMLIAARYPSVRITGVEIQQGAAEIFVENIRLNGIGDRAEAVNADLRELRGVIAGNSFDLVVCNPPYNRSGSGILPSCHSAKIARSDHVASIGDICASAFRLLKSGGELAIVCRADRLSDIIYDMRSAKLEPKRLRFVQHDPDSPPSLILISGRKSGNPGLTVEKPLIMYHGCCQTEEFANIYHGGTI